VKGSRRRSGRSEDRPLHQARKRFGQHFLLPQWAAKVVKAIDPQPGDVFLEIGPGTGAITHPLAATGVPILAVELDRDLVRSLAPTLPRTVTLLSGDVLSVDVIAFLRGLEPQRAVDATLGAHRPIPPARYRVVGNLPYNVATPILLHLIELHRRHQLFADATVMLQREVADRLTARPGTKAYGALTILPSVHATITRLVDLPPGAFRPAPKVRSSVVRLAFGPPAVSVTNDALFERLIKGLFMHRRKTLANVLKRFAPNGLDVLARSGLDGRRRPETLSAQEIARLTDLFARDQASGDRPQASGS
jgi:16S rRNA (adenine1518-N6/adenine1519-N6)-dimethyltransferase